MMTYESIWINLGKTFYYLNRYQSRGQYHQSFSAVEKVERAWAKLALNPEQISECPSSLLSKIYCKLRD